MTLEQIIALLTNKFSGVRKDGLAQLAKSLLLNVTTEEEAQALVDKLTDQQVTEFVKDWRKEVDAEVNKGIDTYKKKNPAPKPEGNDDKGEPNQNPAPENPSNPDIATIVKEAIAAQLKPLQEELSGYKAAEISKQRRTTLEGKLKDAPETFRSKILKDYDRMSFADDSAFDEYLTETETDLNGFKQELADQGLGKFPRPGQGGNGKPSDVPAEVAAYIKSQAPDSPTNLGGKEV